MSMHPSPDSHYERNDVGRIVHLGEVRRRRQHSRYPSSQRYYLAVLLFVAAGAWTVWSIVLFSLPPFRLLTYLAFLAPLWVALASTGAAGWYGVERHMERFPRLSSCLRRGSLGATAVVLNLAFLAGNQWSPVVGIVLTASAVLAEIGLSHRLS